MDKNTQQNISIETIASGIGLAFAFIVLAIFIYFSPYDLGSELSSLIVSSILIVFGVMGLGTTLNKMNNDKKIGFDDIGVGLGLIILWAILHYFFPIIWLNWVLLLLLLVGLYGIGVGTVKLIQNIMTNYTKKSLAIKIPIVVVQIVTITATIIEVLKKFDLL